MQLPLAIRRTIKRALAPVIFRHRPIGLQPARLYLYLDALYRTRDLDGTVVEIGCSVGGTAALAAKMLRDIGSNRDYLCIDTFGGFVGEQFEADKRLGNDPSYRGTFAANDMSIARKVLELHDASEVKLRKADIVALPASELPERISVCLIDVDLYLPVLAALEKVYPHLSTGGMILVDDCPDGYHWQARKAYAKFTAMYGIPPRVEHGVGLISK